MAAPSFPELLTLLRQASAGLGEVEVTRAHGCDAVSAGGRAYLWIMGPLLKGGGALVFFLDYWIRHSPPAFLLFAASDGALALATLWALIG